tara:strand:+ start:4743 stop:5477 length:735 start_codon:yes stop_codon:yes gene_type:complete
MNEYEFPLNERIRKFLRIEEVFNKMEAQILTRKEFSVYSCFNTLFDIMGYASRADLKVELIQEIEKQRLKIKTKIKTKKNIKITYDLDRIRVKLEKSKTLSGFNFGDDKFLHEIKTRSDSPYGILSSDFPEFQFWLERASFSDRKAYFKKKLDGFMPIKYAVTYLIGLLRCNVETNPMQTRNGSIQYKLNPLLKNDLVIITLGKSSNYFPVISANKYAVNVHFSTNQSISKLKLIKFKLGVASF